MLTFAAHSRHLALYGLAGAVIGADDWVFSFRAEVDAEPHGWHNSCSSGLRPIPFAGGAVRASTGRTDFCALHVHAVAVQDHAAAVSRGIQRALDGLACRRACISRGRSWRHEAVLPGRDCDLDRGLPLPGFGDHGKPAVHRIAQGDRRGNRSRGARRAVRYAVILKGWRNSRSPRRARRSTAAGAARPAGPAAALPAAGHARRGVAAHDRRGVQRPAISPVRCSRSARR
jgi:hypothetical protein